MNIILFRIILVFILISNFSGAKAALITYEYSGVITQIVASSRTFGSSLSVGESFNGEIVLDDSVDYGSSANYTVHDVVSWSLSLASDKYLFNYNSSGAQQTIFSVLNVEPESALFQDSVDVYTDIARSLPAVSGYSTIDSGFFTDAASGWSLGIDLDDNSATALASENLPSSFPVPLFTDKNSFLFSASAVSGIDMDTSREFFISGELVSLNAVPVPAAVWLFGSGFISLIGVARRKKG